MQGANEKFGEGIEIPKRTNIENKGLHQSDIKSSEIVKKNLNQVVERKYEFEDRCFEILQPEI